jgi:hypothetical protein
VHTKKSHHDRRIFGALCLTALAGLGLATTSGQSEAAPSPTKSAARIAASKADKDQYTVELKTTGSCRAGSACTAQISLRSKGAYHINDKFPIKFKFGSAPSGVSYAKPIVRREEGKFGATEGTLPVGFTIASAGRAKIGGTFSFSVCTDANCLMEKVDLDLDVDAK